MFPLLLLLQRPMILRKLQISYNGHPPFLLSANGAHSAYNEAQITQIPHMLLGNISLIEEENYESFSTTASKRAGKQTK
ncbi:hypothetical protein J18TS1_18540 [Oceanobacillus oncorhynchi subsp. incaldanensis]|nr:hypothetical protein J18TS1_18540 [Oceanobacillus oncorhynchi subsp. incaldanensis]